MPPQNESQAQEADSDPSAETHRRFGDILDLIQTGYSPNGEEVLGREIERRIAAARSGASASLDKLQAEAEELHRLMHDFLNMMTRSFRDCPDIETPAGAAAGPQAIAAAYAESIVVNAKQPLAVLDEDLRLICASPSFFAVFEEAPGIGEPFSLGQAVPDALTAISQASGAGDREIAIELRGPAPRTLLLTARPVSGFRGERHIVLSVEDADSGKSTAEELRPAKAQAEHTGLARSRFLAAANHGLRQPLQTISFIQGMLAGSVPDPPARKLIAQLDQAVSSMSQMLDKLAGMDREETGPGQPEIAKEMLADAAKTAPAVSLAPGKIAAPSAKKWSRQTVFVVDDDRQVRETMRDVVERHGYAAAAFTDGSAFMEAYTSDRAGCLIADAKMPGIGGLQLIERLNAMQSALPVIIVTAYGDVAMAVRAMKAGAMDFLQKPVRQDDLLDCIGRALNVSGERTGVSEHKAAEAKVQGLTPRQRQILDLVLDGTPTKTIAAHLQLSQRTVDNHRAAIMRKLGAKSLPALIRIALAGQDQGVRNAAMGLR